jgi:hypothetical protein
LAAILGPFDIRRLYTRLFQLVLPIYLTSGLSSDQVRSRLCASDPFQHV